MLRAKDSASTADLSTIFAIANGAKNVQPRHFNRYEEALFRIEARREVPFAAAQLFMELLEQNKVPSWVPVQVDIELIKAAASL
ncbi:MAG: hypothetical protein AAFY26_02050 [Cyanobacteria bacterium J06638_22]